MADVQIQEPSDLGDIHITDPMAEQIAVLVYSKDASSGGIKRLGLLNWKHYLDYDVNRVKNLRDNIDKTIDLDTPFPADAHNIREQIDNIASLTGVPVNPPTVPPTQTINERLQSTETTLNDPSNGLIKKVDDNSNDIQALTELVEGSGGGSSGSITARLSQAENDISSQGTRISALEGTVGDSSNGLVKRVDDLGTSVSSLNTTVGDTNSGLVKTVGDLGTDVSGLKTTVGDSESGLVKEVANHESSITRLNNIVGASPNTGLQGDVKTLKNKVKTWNVDQQSNLSIWLGVDPHFYIIIAYNPDTSKTFMGVYNSSETELTQAAGSITDFFDETTLDILNPSTSGLTIIAFEVL